MASLNHLLIPSLPSSLHLLPPFLDLVQNAVKFEDEYIVNMLDRSSSDKAVKSWANGICLHYEKKRRQEILGDARRVIMHAEDSPTTFQSEVVSQRVHDASQEISASNVEDFSASDGSWGFDDEEPPSDEVSPVSEWGLDDMEAGSGEPSQPSPKAEAMPDASADEDPAAAWGWNDDDLAGDGESEDTPWDDPWNEGSAADTRPPAAPTISSPRLPKAAAGLEKFTSKHKKAQSNGDSMNSPPPAEISHSPPFAPPAKTVARPHAKPSPPIPKETFLVSGYTKTIVGIVEGTLREGKELAISGIMNLPPGSSSSPGLLILQSAPSVLDLFRALYPVQFSPVLAAPERSMRFSSDCIYLSTEVERIIEAEFANSEVSGRLLECQECLRILGDSWFDDSIVSVFV
jgi:centromere/kinetochore protein ZW10